MQDRVLWLFQFRFASDYYFAMLGTLISQLILLIAGFMLLFRQPTALILLVIGASGELLASSYAILANVWGIPSRVLIASMLPSYLTTSGLPPLAILIAACLRAVRRALISRQSPVTCAQLLKFIAYTSVIVGTLGAIRPIAAILQTSYLANLWPVLVSAGDNLLLVAAGILLLARIEAAVPLIILGVLTRLILTGWEFFDMTRRIPSTRSAALWISTQFSWSAQSMLLPGMLFAIAVLPSFRRELRAPI